MISIIAADDHQIFLEGIKSLFSDSSNMQIVATCCDGDSLLSLVSEYDPDIALIDISMPGPGIEHIIESIETSQAKVKLIVLTMHLEAARVKELFKLGLNGYVLKDDAFEQLELAIMSVRDGDDYISPAILEVMKKPGEQRVGDAPILTDRELEVAYCLSEGLTNKMIAQELGVSERTVRFHVSNCCSKLDASRRSQVVARALQLNLFN